MFEQIGDLSSVQVEVIVGALAASESGARIELGSGAFLVMLPSTKLPFNVDLMCVRADHTPLPLKDDDAQRLDAWVSRAVPAICKRWREKHAELEN
jgi:hypothetical protein